MQAFPRPARLCILLWRSECFDIKPGKDVSAGVLDPVSAAGKKFLTTSNNSLPPEAVIFGHSPAMRLVRQKVEKVASMNVPVLIRGESGTGKEVLARFIHERSAWNSGAFVKVNCAAIPGTLLESELFGYQKGAFTGAHTSKPGRVEMAHHGTLFLDEIAELNSGLQAKLLQLLQDGQFCRIGDQEDKRVEARVICVTSRNLEREMEAGNFRPDFFYRINVINIHMPQLRERREDISPLAEYFLSYFNQRFQRDAPPFSKEVLHLLQNQEWPGNIRELENRMARYVILGVEAEPPHEVPDRRPIDFSVQVREDGTIPLKRIAKDAAREMERHLILEVLNANHWNRRRTAQILDISYRALIYKIREAGLSTKTDRRNATSLGDAASNSPE